MLKPAILAFLFLCFLCSACTKVKRVEPDYCVLVAVSRADGKQFYERFDRFAEQRQMSRYLDHGEKGPHTYIAADEKSQIWVGSIYPVGTWESGAEVAHYSVTREPQERMISELKDFIRKEIEARWQVRDCDEMEDFWPTVLFVRAD